MRTFRIVAYRELPQGTDRFDVHASRWLTPKVPTFVSGATSRVAIEAACTKFAVHASDLQTEEWTKETYPPNAEHLTAEPERTVGRMLKTGDVDKEVHRLREAAYAKLQPKPKNGKSK